MGSPSTWADLELGTPGTMACIWNWALQGPSWAGTWTLAHISLPLLLLTLQVCSDWSWQQSTGQAHICCFSLCKCVLTGPGNRVLVRHTPHSHCCFSLCKCVLTGPGNRVLVRHTPHSHCCFLLCKCVLTGPGNRVLVRHTPHSHCCFSLCKCVLTGPGNRVLVRHTPHSHCCFSLCKCVVTGPGNRVLVGTHLAPTAASHSASVF